MTYAFNDLGWPSGFFFVPDQILGFHTLWEMREPGAKCHLV